MAFFLSSFFILVLFHEVVWGCNSQSKELHVCLNIYLERDLPLIETVAQGFIARRGRVLLEDDDLQNICSRLESLYECYGCIQKECDTYWKFERYMRLMNALSETHKYLCAQTEDNQQSTYNLRDLLLSMGCLSQADRNLTTCSKYMDWLPSSKDIMRLQVSSNERCHDLLDFKNCLATGLSDFTCGQEAFRVYGNLIDVWITHWCGSGSSKGLRYLFLPITFKTNHNETNCFVNM